MGHMNRYILRQLAIGTALVAVGLLGILWLTQSLRFVELIITRGLSTGNFLQMTGLLLPNFLVIILPVALFAVVLFTYNKLNTDREIVVLRAAGVGPLGLARPALVLAGALTVLGLGLANYWVPESVRAFREMQWSVRHDMSRLLLQEGAFTTIAPNVTIYLRGRDQSGELLGILMHDTTDPSESVTMMAERGALVRAEGNGARLVLGNGSRHSVEKGTGRLSLLYFDSYTMTLGDMGSEDAGNRFRDARERPMSDLLTLREGDHSLSAVDIRRFRVEGYQRIVNPFSHLTFTLIALATVLTGPFDRRGGGKRVLWGIGAMVITQAAMVGAANMASGSMAFLPLIPAAVVVPLVVAALVLARAGLGWRRPRQTPHLASAETS